MHFFAKYLVSRILQYNMNTIIVPILLCKYIVFKVNIKWDQIFCAVVYRKSDYHDVSLHMRI